MIQLFSALSSWTVSSDHYTYLHTHNFEEQGHYYFFLSQPNWKLDFIAYENLGKIAAFFNKFQQWLLESILFSVRPVSNYGYLTDFY